MRENTTQNSPPLFIPSPSKIQKIARKTQTTNETLIYKQIQPFSILHVAFIATIN